MNLSGRRATNDLHTLLFPAPFPTEAADFCEPQRSAGPS